MALRLAPGNEEIMALYQQARLQLKRESPDVELPQH